MNSKILYIEACNYIDFPIGGQLTFAKQMLKAYGNDLVLVGIASDRTPIRRWIKRRINGKEYDFFATHRVRIKPGKPLIPRRFIAWFYLKLSKKKVLQSHFDYCICRGPEIILAIRNWGIRNLCYYFPGMSNPLEISRRWYARILKNLWGIIFYPSLKVANVILAAADKATIDLTIKKALSFKTEIKIIPFPTRIDTDVFYFRPKNNFRVELGINSNEILVVTTGRLHWAKNHKFLIDAFEIFNKKYSNSIFIIIGNGNLFDDLFAYISSKNLNHCIKLIGFQPPEQIFKYLNIANIFVMGSIIEGWATSLLEAKACATPICTTLFSSAKQIVTDNDGIIVENRDSIVFAEQMEIIIKNGHKYKSDPPDVSEYSVSNLRKNLSSILSST